MITDGEGSMRLRRIQGGVVKTGDGGDGEEVEEKEPIVRGGNM